ncbi:MAG: hypothetical protein ACI9XO_004023, partial [Paraglaciecola sp.]
AVEYRRNTSKITKINADVGKKSKIEPVLTFRFT